MSKLSLSTGDCGASASREQAEPGRYSNIPPWNTDGDSHRRKGYLFKLTHAVVICVVVVAVVSLLVVTQPTATASPLCAAGGDGSEAPELPKPKKNRCFMCRKKVGLTGELIVSLSLFCSFLSSRPLVFRSPLAFSLLTFGKKSWFFYIYLLIFCGGSVCIICPPANHLKAICGTMLVYSA